MPRERDEPNLDKLLTVPCYVYICIRGSRPGRIEQLRRTEESDTASQPGAIKHPHSDLLPFAIPNLYGGGGGSHFNPYLIVPGETR